MNHIGTKPIETPRLLLRRFAPDDAQEMFAGWASDEEVTRYLTWQAHTDLAQSRAIIGLWFDEYQKDDCYRWCIEWKETCRAIGSIDAARIQEKLREAEIGYCMSRAYWGRGIMTEALTAMEDYLFAAGFNRIAARHHVANPASGRVMQKSGMALEGVQRQGGLDNRGDLCDVACYAILQSDRKAQPST